MERARNIPPPGHIDHVDNVVRAALLHHERDGWPLSWVWGVWKDLHYDPAWIHARRRIFPRDEVTD